MRALIERGIDTQKSTYITKNPSFRRQLMLMLSAAQAYEPGAMTHSSAIFKRGTRIVRSQRLKRGGGASKMPFATDKNRFFNTSHPHKE